MKRAILVAIIAVLPSLALGADEAGDYRVKGVGLELCRTYLHEQARKTPTYFLARSWLNGYLTAHNQLTPATYDMAADFDLERLIAWVDAYCKNNPEHQFTTAAMALITTLEPSRLTSKASAEAGPGATQQSMTGQATLQQVQRALKDQGYYRGKVDGVTGPRTRAAIRAFQKKAGLEATGRLDAATLDRMLP